MTTPRPMGGSSPFPEVVCAEPFCWDVAERRVMADRGRLYERADLGEGRINAACGGCVERVINAPDHRGGWWSRKLYPDERAPAGRPTCELCGEPIR